MLYSWDLLGIPKFGMMPPPKKNRVGSWDVASWGLPHLQIVPTSPGMIALVVVPVVERGPISQRMDAMDVITNKLFHITHIKTQTCTPSRGPIESPRVTCRFGTALWCIPHESCRICCVESMGSAWICCYGLGSYDPSYQSVIRCFFWVITQGGKSQHGGKCAWLRKWRGVQVETQRPS